MRQFRFGFSIGHVCLWLVLLGRPASGQTAHARFIRPEGKTIRERVLVPSGWQRTVFPTNSWPGFLQNLRLKPAGAPVLDYTGRPIADQQSHVAVLDYDVGATDLQQCADSVIRLRAEYLFGQKQYDRIRFQFTSGDAYAWSDHAAGLRPVVSGNAVRFVKRAAPDPSYASFRNYLDLVFTYAGTISLSRELKPVAEPKDITVGDVIIQAGSPGHAVLVVDVAISGRGEKLFLLAQGFMPAQSIHVLANPAEPAVDPWYRIATKSAIHTARYDFPAFNVKRFGEP